MSDCPTETAFLSFVEGRLAPADNAEFRRHLEGCSRCKAVLFALAPGEDAISPPTSAGGLASLSTIAIRDALATVAEPQTSKANSLREGMVVAGRYRLERLLGEGGMGVVWAATHEITRKRVALKFLHDVRAHRKDVRRRVLREARAASAVQHPNVVPIHDVLALDDGAPVLVMELLEGESLRAKLERERSIPLRELARILIPVVSAVAVAHEAGVIHRDLKPDNLFLVKLPDGTTEARVLDFGLAKLTATQGAGAGSGELTRSGELVGTPHYMSPEQAFGEEDIDRRTDIWSLGIILYECLAGRLPFAPGNFGQVIKQVTMGKLVPLGEAAPAVPAEVGALVGRMLTVDRAARAADLHEVLALLSRCERGLVGVAAPHVAGELSPGGLPPTSAIAATPDAALPTVAAATPAQPRRMLLWVAAALVGLSVMGGLVWALVTAAVWRSPVHSPPTPSVNRESKAIVLPPAVEPVSPAPERPSPPPPPTATKSLATKKRTHHHPVTNPQRPPTRTEGLDFE